MSCAGDMCVLHIVFAYVPEYPDIVVLYCCAGADICLQVYDFVCVYLISVYVCVCVCGVRLRLQATQSDTPHVGCLCGYMVRIIKAKKTQP